MCKSCGAAIRWVVMEASGKRMPLDAEETAEGNIAISPLDGRAEVVTGARRRDLLTCGEPLYRSHFATCPHAAGHRR